MEAKEVHTNDEIDLLDILAPLMAHWKLLLAVTFLGALAAFVYSKSLPRVYQSKATVFVQQSSPASSFMRNLPIPIATGSGDTGGYLVTVLQSEAMLRKVISRYDLPRNPKFVRKVPSNWEDTIEHLKKSVAVSQDKSGSIMIIAKAYDPALAADMVNCMLDDLGSFVTTASKRKAVFIEKKLDDTLQDLGKAEKRLTSFLEKNSVADIDEMSKEMIRQLGELDGRLIVLDQELQAVISELSNAGRMNVLVEQEVRRRALESSKEYLVARREELHKQLTKLPAVGAEYVRLQRDVMVLTKVFELLTEQYQLTSITQKGEDGDYQIIDRARPNHKKVAPRTMVNTALGGFLTFILAGIAINLRENYRYNKTRRRSVTRSLRRESEPDPVERV